MANIVQLVETKMFILTSKADHYHLKFKQNSNQQHQTRDFLLPQLENRNQSNHL